MICKHCKKPITGGSYTVRGKDYHDECYHELFKNDGESRAIALCPHELPMPCLLCQVKELETQNAIYNDLKDVSLTKDLERIAGSFVGIEKSYAIQAGREIRIIVESGKVTDEESVVLSRDIAKKIESELSYPGQIKVTFIRETRSVEYA